MITERRIHPRHAVLAQIRIRHDSVNHLMEVGDISLSGMFIRASNLRRLPGFEVGTDIEMALFSIEDLDNVELTGRIVRLSNAEIDDETGFAILFVGLTEQLRRNLAKIIQSALITTVEPPPLPKKKR